MQTKSTYNFVPAPKQSEIFQVNWSTLVSHDIPFSDGESGEIDLVLTAETPIYIRNGHSKVDAEVFLKYLEKKESDPNYEASLHEQKCINRYLSFSNCEGKYFIPGSSIKGMIRNVLEIITKSKLNKQLVTDNRYSFRDLTRGSLYMNAYNSNQVKGGWLKETGDGEWYIEECNAIYHIHHEEVDKALNTNFRNSFLGKNPKE